MSTWKDNEGSFAGLYGLANPITTWLIGRGFGELVALTPEEMRREEKPPSCRAQKEEPPRTQGGRWRKLSNKCEQPMRYRAEGWVCYEHKEPVRVPRAMRLQEAPKLIDYGHGPEAFKGFTPQQLVELADKEIDVVYASDNDARPPRWRYVVRP